MPKPKKARRVGIGTITTKLGAESRKPILVEKGGKKYAVVKRGERRKPLLFEVKKIKSGVVKFAPSSKRKTKRVIG